MLIQRFRREAEAAVNLHHPNIVPIYEIGEIAGRYFYSMQLIEGERLDRCIGPQGLPAEPRTLPEPQSEFRARQHRIARILSKLARAVEYAHQQGVLHRDLKPSNIVLDKHGEPHLVDFGVAKVLSKDASDLTDTGAAVGTPSYMAPEQAAGNSKHVTAGADIYGLGAVLYVMLTGKPPFKEENAVATMRQVIEQEPKHPSTLVQGIDADLATIAMKALEKEPTRRYSSASVMADDLDRWMRGEPIRARSVGYSEQFWRWCRRNPSLAGLTLSVAVLLIALALGATAVAIRLGRLNVQQAQRNQQLVDSNFVKDLNNLELRREVLRGLDDLYSDTNEVKVVVPSRRRRLLGNELPIVAGARELIFVEHIYGHPTNMLTTLHPVLSYLERSLAERFKTPFAIDMHLVKSPDWTYKAVLSTDQIFGRIGPALFVQMAESGNPVNMLALQNHIRPLTMALFALNDSEVARMLARRPEAPLRELLSDRSLSLTHATSTTGNYLAKRFLALNGVFSTNLLRYGYAGSQQAVIDAILERSSEVGAGNLELKEKIPQLQVIARFEVPDLGRCWIAGRGLSADVERALQESLLGLHDAAILSRLESAVAGFKPMDEPMFQRLKILMAESRAFDVDQLGKSP